MFAVGSGKTTPFKFMSSISQDLFNSNILLWVVQEPARSWITKSSLPRLCIALPKLAALEVLRLATCSLGVLLSKVSQKKCSCKVVGQTNVTDLWLDKWGFKAMYLHVDSLSFSICIFFNDQSSQKLGWKHQFFDSCSHLERVLSDKAWRGTLVSYI